MKAKFQSKILVNFYRLKHHKYHSPGQKGYTAGDQNHQNITGTRLQSSFIPPDIAELMLNTPFSLIDVAQRTQKK